MAIEYVTIGEITLDDTVLEAGKVMNSQTGGGAVYSALGIRLWGNPVGINAVVGHDYPGEHIEMLETHQVSTEGIRRIEGWSLRLWVLHEENHKKQQLPKLQSSHLADLDRTRPDLPDSYWTAKGYHLAPATSEGQIKSRDLIRDRRPEALISLDILVASHIHLHPYQDGSAYRGVHIFSPSIVEIESIFPDQSIDEVIKFVTGFGVRWIGIKMDTRGSIVHDALKRTTYKIPICPVNTVDTTGAGDAYSGGFLAGIAETGDVLEGGLRGTVSASFAVQNWGAFGMLNATRQEATERLAWLKEHVKTAGG